MAQGTGLAGGIFQGILASEDIANKRDDRQRLQALTLSQLETAQVDRQAKALNMEQTQFTLDEAKRIRERDMKLQDVVKNTYYEMKPVQEMGQDGGFITRDQAFLKDYSGNDGHKRWMTDTRNVMSAYIKSGAIKPEELNSVIKQQMDIQKAIGVERYKSILENPNSPENLNLIAQQLGIKGNIQNAKLDSVGASPVFKVTVDGQTKEYDAMPFLSGALMLNSFVDIQQASASIEASIAKQKAYENTSTNKDRTSTTNENKLRETIRNNFGKTLTDRYTKEQRATERIMKNFLLGSDVATKFYKGDPKDNDLNTRRREFIRKVSKNIPSNVSPVFSLNQNYYGKNSVQLEDGSIVQLNPTPTVGAIEKVLLNLASGSPNYLADKLGNTAEGYLYHKDFKFLLPKEVATEVMFLNPYIKAPE